jgi:hypothetical protein
MEKSLMGLAKSLAPAMEIGGLDILCLLPRDEIVPFGIPFLSWHLQVENDE